MLNTNASILIVDDQAPMRTIIAGNLRSLGFKDIRMAQSGMDAMQILKSHSFSLILSDWNMPEMTGIELLKWVRNESVDHRFTPLIMITAEVKREQIQEAISNGVNDFILKPFTLNTLAERIEKVLSKKSQSRPLSSSKISPSANNEVKTLNPFTLAIEENVPTLDKDEPMPSPKVKKSSDRLTILAVDDAPDNLTLISNLFQDEYRVKIAPNGEKALKICTSDDPPNIVLLDIMMPGMDGFEVIRRLKANETTAELPIIFITALNDAQNIVKGLEAGAVDYITKPIQPTVLQARVKNFLRYHRGYEELKDTMDTMMENAKLRESVEHMVRHDLKAPLSVIIGAINQAVADKKITTQQIEMIEEAAYKALHMINLSTDLYKMETGTFVLQAKPVDVVKLVNKIAEETRYGFTAKKLTISINTVSENIIISGDELLCYSMLHNIFKNAAEAAPNGSSITVSITNSSPVKIAVHNMGAVPKAIRDNFFEKFVTMGKQNGTGLGTYSARLIAEAQKGAITLQTSEESGTTVEISLPKG